MPKKNITVTFLETRKYNVDIEYNPGEEVSRDSILAKLAEMAAPISSNGGTRFARADWKELSQSTFEIQKHEHTISAAMKAAVDGMSYGIDLPRLSEALAEASDSDIAFWISSIHDKAAEARKAKKPA